MDSNAALQLASAIILLAAAGASSFFSLRLSHTAAWIVAAVLLGTSGIFLLLIALRIARTSPGSSRSSSSPPCRFRPSPWFSQRASWAYDGLMEGRMAQAHPAGTTPGAQSGFSASSTRTFEGSSSATRERFIEANRPFASMLGYEVEDLRGKPLASFIRPESRQIENTDTRAGSDSRL